MWPCLTWEESRCCLHHASQRRLPSSAVQRGSLSGIPAPNIYISILCFKPIVIVSLSPQKMLHCFLFLFVTSRFLRLAAQIRKPSDKPSKAVHTSPAGMYIHTLMSWIYWFYLKFLTPTRLMFFFCIPVVKNMLCILSKHLAVYVHDIKVFQNMRVSHVWLTRLLPNASHLWVPKIHTEWIKYSQRVNNLLRIHSL